MDAFSLIEKHFRLTGLQKNALKKLGIETVRDLFFHFPARYGSVAERKKISLLKEGDEAVIRGVISKLKSAKAFRKKIPLTEGVLEDESGKINLVWFHQPYIAKMLREGAPVQAVGKVLARKGVLYIANPKIEMLQNLPVESAESIFSGEKKNAAALYPVYPESRGLTSRWFYYALQKLFAAGIHKTLEDLIPREILKKYHLPSLETALLWVHRPRKAADAESARKRFAFEEVFFIQLARLKARKEFQENPAFEVTTDRDAIEAFLKRFPFAFTSAQHKAVGHILEDFKKGKPMARLLEGDVGSGKTAVAALTAFCVATSRPTGQDFGNLQVAIMAPTEILAQQHFESFIEHFRHLPVQVGLITGSAAKKFPSKVNPEEATTISKKQLLKWVANGEIPILVGTHTLIEKSVRFKHLAYIIIDEQHRFGVSQRLKLKKKEARVPHFLSMTATPIPRTLALTIYGDLDLTLLDEMPPGRKPIVTEIVPKEGRNAAYEKVQTELKKGRQVYVICPRIHKPDPKKELALIAKSVKEEAARLKKEVFPGYEIGILHSKLTPKEKADVMGRFLQNKINVLVATSVVEVGVNVPNATTIIIEGAERFGLAQLHQLRGRVLRSTHQAYCYIFSDAKGGNISKRLEALKHAKNGFELAERDLEIRGAGELSGRKQWGISDIGMEAIKNLKMVEAAREEATKILRDDPELAMHPTIHERVRLLNHKVHFE